MDSDRWQRINEVFFEALDRAPAERTEFLDRACSSDSTLRVEVEKLLANDAGSTVREFLDSPAVSFTDHASDPADDPLLGRELGAYRIERHIGSGGMGAVYAANRVGDYRQRVAIKVIRRGFDTDEILRRFRDEVQFLAVLSRHPNIARLLDAGKTQDDSPYYVMEYVDGQQLDSYADSRNLGVRERLEIFCQVCDAVQYAHQHTVIHRDLKPSNVLVAADGAPKLIDFGIAKLMNPELGFQTLTPTRTEHRVLTPDYASPEQLRGDPLSTATDVYSLGVVLYELLAGHRPFRITTRLAHEIERFVVEADPELPSSAVFRRETVRSADGTEHETTAETVSHARSTRPQALRRALAGDLDNIVLMALRKEPERRYASAEQLAADVRRHLDGLPVVAQRDSVRYRALKFVKRNRLAVGAAALILLSLLAGIVGTSSQWQRAEEAAELLREENRRTRRNLYVANMNLVEGAIEAPDLPRAIELLERHRPAGSTDGGTDLRGFEWYYWWARTRRYLGRLEEATEIAAIAYSPDGRYLATSGEGQVVTIWDLRERVPWKRLQGHSDWVRVVSFSPDGRRIASAGLDHTVRLWELETGREMAVLEGHTDPVRTLAYSPRGELLLSAGYDGQILVWDASSGAPRRRLAAHEDIVYDLAFSPTAPILASAGADRAIKIWSATSFEPIQTVRGARDARLRAVAFSPDGRLLVSGDGDGGLELWRVDSKALVDIPTAGQGAEVVIVERSAQFSGHDREVHSLAFSPDGKTLASSSQDWTVKLWDVDTTAAQATLRATIRGHLFAVYGVVFSPDGKTLASCSQDKTVKLWDPTTDAADVVLEGHTDDVEAVAVSGDGAIIVSASADQTVRLWSRATGRIEKVVTAQSPLLALAVSPNGATLAAAGEGRQIEIWDLESGAARPSLDGHEGGVLTLRFSPADGRLASAGRDGIVRVWDLDGERSVGTLVGHDRTVWCATWAPDGRSIASSSSDGTVRLWDVATARETRRLEGHDRRVYALAFSGDGTKLASGGQDRVIRLWDVATGNLDATFSGHALSVHALVFVDNDASLASASTDKTIRLWDLTSHEPKSTLRGHRSPVQSIALTPDGKILVTGSADNTVRLWHAAMSDGAPLRRRTRN